MALVPLNKDAPTVIKEVFGKEPLIFLYAKRYNIAFNKQMVQIIDELFPKTKVGGFLIFNEADPLIFYIKFINQKDTDHLHNVFKLQRITNKKYDSGWYQGQIKNYYVTNGFYPIDRIYLKPELIIRDKTAYFKVDLTPYKDKTRKYL